MTSPTTSAPPPDGSQLSNFRRATTASFGFGPEQDVGVTAVDVASLRYFVAVVDEQHFGRAAAKLHLTQQAASAAVARLERSVGARLIDRRRGRRGFVVTPDGQRLYLHARRVLAAVDDLHDALGRSST